MMNDPVDNHVVWARWGRSWEDLRNEKGIIGCLRVAEEGRIKLFVPCESILNKPTLLFDTNAESAEWLYGLSKEGRYYSIRNCRQLSAPPGSQEIIADLWLTSDYEFDPEPSISSISFGLQHLENWAILKNSEGESVFRSFFMNFDSADSSSHCIRQTWFSGEKLEIQITTGITMALNLPESVVLRNNCSITIQFVDSVDFETASEIAFSVHLLVSFCAGWYAGLQNIKLVTNHSQTIEVTVGQSRGMRKWKNPTASPIPYEVFASRSQELVEAWLTCDGDLKSAIHEYVPIALLRRPIYADLEYVAAWQILEALGRTINTEEHLADIEQAEELSRLIAEAEKIEDGELKAWVLGHLGDPKYPSLLNLAKGVCRYVGDYSKALVRDSSKFTFRASSKRHSLVHRKTDVTELQNEGNLFVYAEGLLMLSQAAIMVLMGFSQTEVKELLTKYNSVRNQVMVNELRGE